jgi:hypothetical protein
VTKRAQRLIGLAALAMCAALFLPDPASACAVCTGGQSDEVRYALVWGSGFLSVLPLVLVGGLAWYVRRRAREIAAKQTRPAEAILTRSAASR